MSENGLTREQIIDKVKKLMALSKGSNFEGETDTALQKARDLLAKYNMDMSEVEAKAYQEAKPEFKESDIQVGAWQFPLAKVIGSYVNCSPFYSSGINGQCIRFIGMKAELEICIYTYHHVAQQIDKMCRNKRKELRAEREESGLNRQDRRASSEFTKGYALGIIYRLKERIETRLQSEVKGTALVLVEHPKIMQWKRANLVASNRRSRITASGTGYSQGYRDGDKVTINPGLRSGSNKWVK